jgi:DNA-binding LacI/PurR family transcriptional regulator
MAELARLANVDVSTVSRALNDSPLVKEDTKAEILKIAAERGYAVNASARNLRRQSSEAIGIVIPLRPESGQTISDPFFLEMVGAVSQAASARGYDLIINVPESQEQSAEQRLLRTGRADGLIIIGQAGRSDLLDALGPLAKKVVVWGGKSEPVSYTLVGSDNREGGRLAAEHLLSLGRSRILFMGPFDLPEARLRLQGFEDAHAARGLKADETLRLNVEFGAASVFDMLLDFMKNGPQFDAIFAASDVLAMTAILALQAKKRRVPDDVAVVGYDNIGQSRLSSPPLTTIDQNIAAGGALLVDLLLRKLAGEDVSSQLTPTRLIVRQSTLPG